MKSPFFFVGICSLLLIFTHISYSFPSSDTLHVLAIRVAFKTDSAATTTGDGRFDLGSDSDPNRVDPPPHNRAYFQDHLTFLSNYYRRISRGSLVISGDVFPEAPDAAYRLDLPMTAYNPNTTPAEINSGLARLFRDAIQKADADTAIDFSQYQAFIIFHAGVGKDVDLGFDETPQDIPSLFISGDFLQEYLGQSAIAVDDGAVQVTGGLLLPETESQAGLQLGLNGIVVANFGSQLGLLDMFSPDTRSSGIGRFGLMDAGLFNGDGLLPAVPCAWSRIDAGWDEPVTVDYGLDDQYTVYQPLAANGPRVYRIPINAREYFLVEDRYAGPLNLDSLRFELARGRSDYPTVREVLQTFYSDQVTFSERGVLIDVKNPDIGLPGSGCLIWHIDENIIDQNRAANRINADPDHRGVDLEEADGSQDIGQRYDFLSPGAGSETGYVLDMWYRGNTAPVFKNEFSPVTFPNSRSYYHRANSHITLSDFSRGDSVMTFRVKLNIFQQNFPIQINTAQFGEITSLKTADPDGDGVGELVMTTSNGYLLLVSSNDSGQTGFVSVQNIPVSASGDLLPPPVVFPLPDASGQGVVALSRSGTAYGIRIGPGSPADTLFSPFQCADSITTHPIAYQADNGEMRIFWGCANGEIYRAIVGNGAPVIEPLYQLNEAIKYVHVNSDREVMAVTISGKLYRNAGLEGAFPVPDVPPVGRRLTGITRDGWFISYQDGIAEAAVAGLYPFLSPLVAIRTSAYASTPAYFVCGNNKLLAFNYNFSLMDNFPVPMYRPDRNVDGRLSPLVSLFTAADLSQKVGIVVTDPAGVIDGFDIHGKRLADFPLATGDAIPVTPVLLDLDGDRDAELAAVTRAGMLYVWDLASDYRSDGWNQLYDDALNSNLNPGFPGPVPLHPDFPYGNSLLPKNRVYNWPNPATEGYTFIRYYLRENADVRIKIFDLAGDLVREFPGPGYGATDNEIRWDVQNVQSGVYLARVEASSAGKTETRIIKIAVIK